MSVNKLQEVLCNTKKWWDKSKDKEIREPGNVCYNKNQKSW